MKTSDYTIFRNINGNRKVNEGHVLRLTSAIERKNLLPYYPILCNEHMEIIDGQHRLAAAIRLGYDVHYAEISGLRIEDVMEINTNSKSWSIKDFINSWIVLDKPDYRVLRSFMEQYGLSPTIAACLLRGYNQVTGGGDIARVIKSGDFRVSSEPFAQKIAGQVVEARMHADFEPANDREFIAALMKLSSNHSFDFDRLTAKLRLHELRLQKRPSEKYYILYIEELYNFHNSIVTELYKSTYTG